MESISKHIRHCLYARKSTESIDNNIEKDIKPTIEVDLKENINENNQESPNQNLGDNFRDSLVYSRDMYNDFSYDVIKGMFNEKLAEANKDSSILLLGIDKFTENPNVPEKTRQILQTRLMLIRDNDPLSTRMRFYSEQDPVEKNRLAEEHDEKIAYWKSAIGELLDTLRDVIPDSMVDELLHRSNMFAGPLQWTDSQQEGVK